MPNSEHPKDQSKPRRDWHGEWGVKETRRGKRQPQPRHSCGQETNAAMYRESDIISSLLGTVGSVRERKTATRANGEGGHRHLEHPFSEGVE